MAPKLYLVHLSPPARCVLITAKHINLDLELKILNIMQGENKSPEYLKMNPQHTIPTLDDNGFYLADSHAIAAYLVEKYAKDDSLYPKDPKKKAIINQRLHFDNGVLFTRLIRATSQSRKESRPMTEEELETLAEGLGFLEAFLKEGEYAAGSDLSIADFSLVSTVSTIDIVLPIDEGKFPKVAQWFKKMQSLPAYEVNKQGLQEIRALLNKPSA